MRFHSLTAVFLSSSLALAQDIDVPALTKSIVANILSIYGDTSAPGFVPGILPDPYYFWEAGLMFDALINYWSLTGDDSVVNTITQALLFQTGENLNYMPANQTRILGNDDQARWALAAMTAAEHGLPVPAGANVSWHELAANVFDSQVQRWDNETCGGGLRWQIFAFNNGYSYKNTVSQAAFALLGARLARFLPDRNYLEPAARAIEWSRDVGLITDNGIFDGTDVSENCTDVNRLQWSENAGLHLSASIYACNSTAEDCGENWLAVNNVSLNNALDLFAPDSILTEVACAPNGNCNVDQRAFRASLARALALSKDTPLTETRKEDIKTVITASARGANAQCSGDEGCGSDWSASQFDGVTGLGENLAALEILLATLPQKQLNTLTNTVTGSGTMNNGTGNTTTGSDGNEGAAAGGSASGSGGAALVGNVVLASIGTLLYYVM